MTNSSKRPKLGSVRRVRQSLYMRTILEAFGEVKLHLCSPLHLSLVLPQGEAVNFRVWCVVKSVMYFMSTITSLRATYRHRSQDHCWQCNFLIKMKSGSTTFFLQIHRNYHVLDRKFTIIWSQNYTVLSWHSHIKSLLPTSTLKKDIQP